MKRILYDRMNFPKSAVGAAKGYSRKLSMELPALGAGHARVVLTSEQGFESISADYVAEDGTVVNGKRFAAVDIKKPFGQKLKYHMHLMMCRMLKHI